MKEANLIENISGCEVEASTSIAKFKAMVVTYVSQIAAAPGYILFFIWSILFGLLWFVCNVAVRDETRFCYANEAIVSVRKETMMYGFAAIIFAMSAMMNMFATVMQSAKKKKQCASLVFFVEVVSCATYSSLFFKAFPDLKNMDGKPFDWIHLFQWGFTTPAMLIILSALGSSLDEQYINNWPLTRKAVVIVEVVLMFGVGSLIYTGIRRFVFLFFAVSGYILLCRTIGEIMHFAIENAGTAMEVQTLVVLKWTTYVLWSLFGMLQSMVLPSSL